MSDQSIRDALGITTILSDIAALKAKVDAIPTDVATTADVQALKDEIVKLTLELNLGGTPDTDDGGGGGGGAVVIRKGIRFTKSTQSLLVYAGKDLDTPGATEEDPSDDVLAPCAFIFSMNRRDAGSITFAFNNAGANNRGLQLRINSGKLRATAGSSATELTSAQGAASWDQDVPDWGAAIWDGTAWTLMKGGVVDPSTVTVSTAAPQYGEGITFAKTGDDHDLAELVYIRGVVTPGQVNAIKAKLVAGNFAGAATDINAFDSEAGFLVGPTGDDTNDFQGIVEHCAGRTAFLYGAPAFIDAFA